MKKRILSALAACLMLVGLLTGCAGKKDVSEPTQSTTSTTAAEKVKINVIGIKGPTGVGMVNLWSKSKDGKTANDYTFSAASTPDEAIAKLTTGEAQIAAIPTNAAAALYRKTSGNVQMLAVNTLGVLYILEKGTTIHSVKDLKGKTILSTGQGANPEYILNYVLEKNGLKVGTDVKVEYVSENDELATRLVSGKADIAMVPEPVATTVMTKKNTFRAALDMTKEWETVAPDSKLMMGCVAVQKSFAEKNPAAIASFLEEYKASIDATSSDLDGTAALCEQFEIIASSAVAKKAIPNCNLTFVSGNDMMKQIAGYFQVLFDANPKSVGGKLPDEGFYYKG